MVRRMLSEMLQRGEPVELANLAAAAAEAMMSTGASAATAPPWPSSSSAAPPSLQTSGAAAMPPSDAVSPALLQSIRAAQGSELRHARTVDGKLLKRTPRAGVRGGGSDTPPALHGRANALRKERRRKQAERRAGMTEEEVQAEREAN